MLARLSIVLVSFISSFSCTPEFYWYECKAVPSWNVETIVSFTNIEIKSPSEVNISVLHTDTYGYENIYIKAIVTGLASDTVYQKINSISLMREGQWLGNKSGDLYEVHYIVDSISTNLPQTINVYLEQYSRDTDLKGVEKVCISVKEMD